MVVGLTSLMQPQTNVLIDYLFLNYLLSHPLISMTLYMHYLSAVEPLNNGHIGDNMHATVLSFVCPL